MSKSPEVQPKYTKIEITEEKRMEELYKSLQGCSFSFQATSLDDFKILPIEEKVKKTQEILKKSEKDGSRNEDLRKAAYYALSRAILAHNLDPNNKRLEVIYDQKHEHKATEIEELENIRSFIEKNNKSVKDFEIKPIPKKRTWIEFIYSIAIKKDDLKRIGHEFKIAGKGIISESSNLASNIFTEVGKLRTQTVKDTLKNIDKHCNNSLNRARQYFKSDPTIRSPSNRVKQFAGASLNLSVWFGKQCVNVIRKPIACVANITKTSVNTAVLVVNAAIRNEKAIQATKKELITNIKDAARDFRESFVAATTLFCTAAFTPGLSTAAAAVMGGLGVAGAAVATGILATAHASNILMTAPGLVAQAGENTLKAAYISAEYKRTGPELYLPEERTALGQLYTIAKADVDPKIKQEAIEKIYKLEEHIKTELMKQDSLGRAIHQVNSLSGEIASAANKMLGTYFNETGSGIKAPRATKMSQETTSKNNIASH